MSAASLIKAVYRAVDAAIAGIVDGQEVVPSVDDHGNLRVAVTNSTDRTATGTINEATPGVGKVTYVEIVSQGCGTVGVDIRTADFNGTLVFEATVDGTNWEPVPATAPVGGAEVTSIALVGAAYSELWVVMSAGYGKVRVRCSVYAAGTVAVSLEASSAGQDVSLANPLPVGDNLVGRVKVSDGTTVSKVAPVSTAAAFTDPALIADVRPGGVFPAGAAPADGESYGTLSKIRALLMLKTTGAATLDIARASLTGVISSVTGVLSTLPIVRYVATRVTLTDGQATEMQGNARGDLAIAEQFSPAYEDNVVGCAFTRPLASSSATGTWTPYASAAKVGTAGISVSAAAGNIRKFYGLNSHATNEYYLLIVDKASAPVANDLPIWATRLPPLIAGSLSPNTDGASLDFGEGGLKVVNGVAYAISTTMEKVTLPGSSDCMVFGLYK